MNSQYPYDKDQVVPGKPILKTPHLLQRGRVKVLAPLTDNFTFDALVRLDYMGAAEYEFGAVPASLQQFVYHRMDGSRPYFTFPWMGHEFYVISASGEYESQSWYSKLFDDLFTHRISIKMGARLDSFLQGPTKEQIKKGCKKKTETVDNYGYTDFWWDIENHFMVWPIGNTLPPAAFEDAFRHLREKGWNRPVWLKSDASTIIKNIKKAATRLLKRGF